MPLHLYSEEVVVVANKYSRTTKITDLADLESFRVLYPPKESAIRPLVARLLIFQGVPLFRNRIGLFC
jgi:LysR family pca operon transcriptional activator